MPDNLPPGHIPEDTPITDADLAIAARFGWSVSWIRAYHRLQVEQFQSEMRAQKLRRTGHNGATG